jgi:glyceraldehyde 3-phosphate dehydrogenase
MKKLRLAINGFGRIGRCFLRASLRNPEFMNSVSIIAINDLVDATTLAHLLKYDSAYGRFDGRVVTKVQNDSHNGNKNVSIILNETIEIKILSERYPALLPWKELGIDIALES